MVPHGVLPLAQRPPLAELKLVLPIGHCATGARTHQNEEITSFPPDTPPTFRQRAISVAQSEVRFVWVCNFRKYAMAAAAAAIQIVNDAIAEANTSQTPVKALGEALVLASMRQQAAVDEVSLAMHRASSAAAHQCTASASLQQVSATAGRASASHGETTDQSLHMHRLQQLHERVQLLSSAARATRALQRWQSAVSRVALLRPSSAPELLSEAWEAMAAVREAAASVAQLPKTTARAKLMDRLRQQEAAAAEKVHTATLAGTRSALEANRLHAFIDLLERLDLSEASSAFAGAVRGRSPCSQREAWQVAAFVLEGEPALLTSDAPLIAVADAMTGGLPGAWQAARAWVLQGAAPAPGAAASPATKDTLPSGVSDTASPEAAPSDLDPLFTRDPSSRRPTGLGDALLAVTGAPSAQAAQDVAREIYSAVAHASDQFAKARVRIDLACSVLQTAGIAQSAVGVAKDACVQAAATAASAPVRLLMTQAHELVEIERTVLVKLQKSASTEEGVLSALLSHEAWCEELLQLSQSLTTSHRKALVGAILASMSTWQGTLLSFAQQGLGAGGDGAADDDGRDVFQASPATVQAGCSLARLVRALSCNAVLWSTCEKLCQIPLFSHSPESSAFVLPAGLGSGTLAERVTSRVGQLITLSSAKDSIAGSLSEVLFQDGETEPEGVGSKHSVQCMAAAAALSAVRSLLQEPLELLSPQSAPIEASTPSTSVGYSRQAQKGVQEAARAFLRLLRELSPSALSVLQDRPPPSHMHDLQAVLAAAEGLAWLGAANLPAGLPAAQEVAANARRGVAAQRALDALAQGSGDVAPASALPGLLVHCMSSICQAQLWATVVTSPLSPAQLGADVEHWASVAASVGLPIEPLLLAAAGQTKELEGDRGVHIARPLRQTAQDLPRVPGSARE